MSIPEYVDQLTSSQLNYLIDYAEKRKVAMTDAGHVLLYGVFSVTSIGWFESREDAEAVFMATAQEVLGNKNPELSMESRKVALCDLAEYLGAKKAKEIIDDGSLIVKPNRL